MKQDGRSWGNGLQARAFPVDGGARPRNRSAQAQVAAIRDQSRDANWVGRHLFEPGKPSRDVGMTPRDLRAGAISENPSRYDGGAMNTFARRGKSDHGADSFNRDLGRML